MPGDARPTWTYIYCNCGRIKKVIDPEGNAVEYGYDDRNRLHTVTLADPDGEEGELSEPVWTYNHNARGDLVSVVDPGGRETLFGYDDARRLIQRTDPDPDGPGGPQEKKRGHSDFLVVCARLTDRPSRRLIPDWP